MNKKLTAGLLGLGVAGLMGLGTGFASAEHNDPENPQPRYSSDCGESIETDENHDETHVYQSEGDPDPTTGGHIGVSGNNGYIEASGSADGGGIDGGLADGSFYGAVEGAPADGDARVCIGGAAPGGEPSGTLDTDSPPEGPPEL